MQMTPTFELKVAVIGNVNAGKTTLLNAILQGQFGEVSMRRTTAAVNYFIISTPPTPSPNDGRQVWAMMPDEAQTAAATLREITHDNATLRVRTEEVQDVKERTFNVVLPEAPCKMRPDTKLVFVDIPGINEAGANQMYRNWVNDHWQDFDVVVVVVEGVNTEEQENLLKMVKTNNSEKKNIPFIIVFNKMDDPNDDELMDQLKESLREVENIFNVDDRGAALQRILDSAKQGDHSVRRDPALFPTCIPMSAITAFIYQCCSHMPFDEFKEIDKKLIAMLGREGISRKDWRKMSPKEQIESAYGVAKDAGHRAAALSESGFDRFCQVLDYTIGDHVVQRETIEKQIELSLNALTSESGGFAKVVRSNYERIAAISESSKAGDSMALASLKGTFWRLYTPCEDSAFLDTHSKDISKLSLPAQELIDYCLFARENGWNDEVEVCCQRLKQLVRRQLKLLVAMHKDDDSSGGWKIPPADWISIFGSFSALSCEYYWCRHFGKDKLLLEMLFASCVPTLSGNATIEMVEDLSQPMHFGHVAFLYCELMKKLEKETKQ